LSLSAVRSFFSHRLKGPVRWRRLLLELLLAVGLFIAIDQWMSRNLLESQQAAPVSVLPTLSGGTARLPETGGNTLVYFFAPWCTVCHLSIGNLVDLAAQQPELNIQLVALDYGTVDEVRAFIAEKALPFPVLLGNATTFRQWQISGYPTYYMVGEAGNIRARSMGYSTQAGLWVRSLL